MEFKTVRVADLSGNVMKNADVRVYRANTTTEVTVFDENGVTLTTAQLKTDANGAFGFKTFNGVYDIVASLGSTTATVQNVQFNDPPAYTTVAAFFADVTAGYTAPDGTVVSAGPVQFQADSSASVSGLPVGWVPFGDVTPIHFGAVGDGVADDTAAVQAVIDSLPDVGGEVLFPATEASVYLVASKPTVGTKRVVFKYEGGARFSSVANYPDGTNLFGFHPVGADTSFYASRIIGDTVDQPAITGTKVNGQKVQHEFGGAGTRGGRHGIYGVLIQGAATESDNPDRNYVGIQGQVLTASGDGGTATTLANGKGAYFGMSSIATMQSGAVNLLNVSGAEINTQMLSGSSVAYKSGLQIVTKDEVQGAIFDAALAISKSGTSLGNKTGILFGNMNGGHPVATDGTLILHLSGATLGRGLDFRGVTFSGPVLDAPGLTLKSGPSATGGVGAGIEMGSLTNSDTPSLDFHSSGNNIDFDSRIAASGGSANTGEGVITHTAGVHVFTTRGAGLSGQAFRVAANGTTVNYVQVTGAAAGGSGPQVQAEGTDANIDLRLIPKGTGRVRFGAHVGQADAPIIGHIEIKDASGNIRKLAVVA